MPLVIGERQSLKVNCQEAYSLWDVASSGYQGIERARIYRNFAHDKDLSLIVDRLVTNFSKRVAKVEEAMAQAGVAGPDVGVINTKTAVNTEVLRDEGIAQALFLWLQMSVDGHLRAQRSCTTNDAIRSLLIGHTREVVAEMDMAVQYMRVKGWLNNPPLYPSIPTGVTEKLDTGEAFHLWDHLTFRYDSMHLTMQFAAFAHDLEFKALLELGIHQALKKQCTLLEGECLTFGIPLPKHPPNVVTRGGASTGIMPDDQMFRSLYMGIVGAAVLHSVAVNQATTNDRIRRLFVQLLFEEIATEDKVIKYGKAKGWVSEPPQYKLSE